MTTTISNTNRIAAHRARRAELHKQAVIHTSHSWAEMMKLYRFIITARDKTMPIDEVRFRRFVALQAELQQMARIGREEIGFNDP